MALVQNPSEDQALSVTLKSQEIFQLPPKERTPDLFIREIQGAGTYGAALAKAYGGTFELSQEALEFYKRHMSGGAQSFTERSIEIHLEGTDEMFVLGARTSTKVSEIKETLGFMAQRPDAVLRIKRNRGAARPPLLQRDNEEVASKITVAGLTTLKPPVYKPEHPVVVIGGGLGGLQTALVLKSKGREDVKIVERHPDFGGHSWITVANKYTKLQTETGTYFLDYVMRGITKPSYIGDAKYSPWPSRDILLNMFRQQAMNNGLYDFAMFNTSVEKVVVKGSKLPDRHYALQCNAASMSGEDVILDDSDGFLVMAGAVSAWPGNLCLVNRLEWPGEDEFEGYIEYSSFDKVDYTRAEGRNVILYGHGAFTIENVRTLVEHRCKKVFVMCRKRNLCGMKMVSWLCHVEEKPVPGNIMLDAFQLMYDLVGFNVWTAFSVKTDEQRSFALIDQRTVFGVTDIYFLAGYYGLMEVIVDEIKRLSRNRAHTVKGKVLGNIEMIIKAVGTSPDPKIDKVLGIQELVGFWANGDPLRPVSCNGMFVKAQNFGSFSSGPSFASLAALHAWFIEFPWDMDKVLDALPRNKAGDNPAYVPPSKHFLPTYVTLNMRLPLLDMDQQRYDGMKAPKTAKAHPLEQHLAEVKAEWEMYIEYFKKHNMVDDRPDPPYPYTKEIMEDFQARARQANQKENKQQPEPAKKQKQKAIRS